MEKLSDMQKKVMENFLKRHFISKRVRVGNKFKRIVIGYDDKIYYLSDEMQKSKLKTHLTETLSEIFSFDLNIIKKVVSRFI